MAKDKEMTTAKIMPNNLEAEQSVLCSAMIDQEAAVNILARLNEKDFYSEAHQEIFKAMLALYAQNKPVDLSCFQTICKPKTNFVQLVAFHI